MALSSANVVVANTATLVHSSAVGQKGRPEAIIVHNDGANIIYLGGSNVTTSNGMPIIVDAYVSIDLQQGDNLYGIVASGTENLRKLVSVQ